MKIDDDRNILNYRKVLFMTNFLTIPRLCSPGWQRSEQHRVSLLVKKKKNNKFRFVQPKPKLGLIWNRLHITNFLDEGQSACPHPRSKKKDHRHISAMKNTQLLQPGDKLSINSRQFSLFDALPLVIIVYLS